MSRRRRVAITAVVTSPVLAQQPPAQTSGTQPPRPTPLKPIRKSPNRSRNRSPRSRIRRDVVVARRVEEVDQRASDLTVIGAKIERDLQNFAKLLRDVPGVNIAQVSRDINIDLAPPTLATGVCAARRTQPLPGFLRFRHVGLPR